MTLKEQIRKIVDELPDGDENAIEEMQYRLYVLKKIQGGMRALDSGEAIPHEKVVKRMKKWIPSQ